MAGSTSRSARRPAAVDRRAGPAARRRPAAAAAVASRRPPPPRRRRVPLCDCLERGGEVYAALCLGVRDYVRKNRFQQVVMGISGGIDSALTACIAVDALGKDKVNAVSMPSRYSSAGTKTDARETAERLGVHFYEIPIETVYEAYLETPRPRTSATRRPESPSRTSRPASAATS